MEEAIEKRFQQKLNTDNCLLCLKYSCSRDLELSKKLKEEITDRMGLVSLQCQIFNSFSPIIKIKYFIKRLFMEPLSDTKRKEVVNFLCANNYYSLIFIVNQEDLHNHIEFKDLFVFNRKKFKIKNYDLCGGCAIMVQLLNLNYLGIEIDDDSFKEDKEVIIDKILYGYNGYKDSIFKDKRKKIIDYFKRNTHYNDLIIEELKKNMKSILHLLTTDDEDEKKHSIVMKIDTLLMLYEGLIGIDDDWIKLDKTRY